MKKVKLPKRKIFEKRSKIKEVGCIWAYVPFDPSRRENKFCTKA